jgi:hypothetical protein
VLRYGEEIGRLLLTTPGYSAHVLTFSRGRSQTMPMVTATDVTFLTVAIYLLDLGIKIVALGLVPEGRRPSSATAWLLLILFLPIEELARRPLPKRYLDNVMRLTSALQ